MRVLVKLNMCGHFYMTRELSLPQVFYGMVLNFKPEVQYDLTANIRIDGLRYIYPDYAGPGRNEGYWMADGTPYGVMPKDATVGDLRQAFEAIEFKVLPTGE